MTHFLIHHLFNFLVLIAVCWQFNSIEIFVTERFQKKSREMDMINLEGQTVNHSQIRSISQDKTILNVVNVEPSTKKVLIQFLK
jgi:hypothetical protein